MADGEMIALLDELLELRRSVGAHQMMLQAAKCLTKAQCMTAYAMASELMRSDGPFEPEERRFLDHLAVTLEISKFEAQRIDTVFEIFHASLTLSSTLEVTPSVVV
ncbi:MAG: tellurite resistance TerB family protein [Synechococcus sp.]